MREWDICLVWIEGEIPRKYKTIKPITSLDNDYLLNKHRILERGIGG